MTEKEYDVKMGQLRVRSATVSAKICKVEMEEGYRKLKANMEIRYEALKAAHEQSLIELEEAQLDLSRYREAADKNFDG